MLVLKALPYFLVLTQVLTEGKYEDDIGLDIYKFLKKYRYPVETHWVQTEDGYVLRMQRISRRNATYHGKQHKPAVLIMHGLLCSAMDFVNKGPGKALGLMLADAGYDVWLGNNRGTTWSRNHVTLDPDYKEDAPKFWNFSYEKCGYYDLTAKIDYIIEKTGQPKIFYVGHSQGTTQFFAMAALRPEYNEKIALMTALAPVAYMKHMSSPLPRLMAKYMDLAKSLVHIFNLHEILGHSWILREIVKTACSGDAKTRKYCSLVLFTLCGYDPSQYDPDFIPVLISNAPAGISVDMLVHYGQGIRSGDFRRYDYGTLTNLKYYHSTSPPSFNISAITAPVALYYAQNDFFAAVQDVEKLAKELPILVKKRLIENKFFNHIDYISAKDVDTIINLDVIQHMDEYINETIPTPDPPITQPSPGNAGNKNVAVNCVAILIVMLLIKRL